MHKERHITIPIYRGEFMLIISNKPKKIEKLIPNSNYEDADAIYAHAWKHGGGNKFAIVLNLKNDTSNIHHGVIAHEVEHIKNMLFEQRDIGTDSRDDEAQAYFVEWLTDIVYGWLNEMGVMKYINFK